MTADRMNGNGISLNEMTINVVFVDDITVDIIAVDEMSNCQWNASRRNDYMEWMQSGIPVNKMTIDEMSDR